MWFQSKKIKSKIYFPKKIEMKIRIRIDNKQFHQGSVCNDDRNVVLRNETLVL